MEYIIGVIIGVIISCVFVKFTNHKPSGTFFIDFSDPLKDVCRLELEEDINVIYKKKRMILNIKTFEPETQK